MGIHGKKVVTHRVHYEDAGIPDIVFRRFRGIPDEQICIVGSICSAEEATAVAEVLFEWARSPKEFWVYEKTGERSRR